MSENRNSKIAILTLDPEDIGGIYTLCRDAYGFFLKNGFRPELLFHGTKYYKSGSIKDKIASVPKRAIERYFYKEVRGMKGIGVHTLPHFFECLEYLHNFPFWIKILKRYDKFMVVSGNNQVGLPLVLLRKPFVLWVASTMVEDREERMRKFMPFERMRDGVSLPVCLWMERLIFTRAARIIALSGYTAAKIRDKYGIPFKAIDILGGCVDTTKFFPVKKKTKDKDHVKLLCVARINDPRKRVELLLRLFSKLREMSRKNMQLTLVGGLPNTKFYNVAAQLGIAEQVCFLGTISEGELVKEYQSADIFVLPSQQEGFGIPLIEAMACSLPVVTTRCGGPEDLVVQGMNGYIHDVDDFSGLSTSLMKLSDDPELRSKMGSKGRHFVERFYSKEAFENKLRRILQQSYDA